MQRIPWIVCEVQTIHGCITKQACANDIKTPNHTGSDNVSLQLSLQNYSYEV